MQFSRLITKENLRGSYNSRSQGPESVINLAPGFKKSQLRITSYSISYMDTFMTFMKSQVNFVFLSLLREMLPNQILERNRVLGVYSSAFIKYFIKMA